MVFFLYIFPSAWVGPINLLLSDLFIYRCRPVGEALPYFNMNVERFEY